MAGANSQNSFALIIGVGKREQDHINMRISANDADYIDNIIRTFLTFPEGNVVKKTNQEACQTCVLDELDDLAAKTAQKQAELVIVYFSGHGCRIRDKYYLVCNNTKSTGIETGGIEGSVFVGKLNKINTSKMIVLLDCCHSQGVADTSIDNPIPIPFDENELISRQNRVIITACGRDQVSYLCEPVSLFTYVLIEGLLGHCFTPGDTDVKVFQLALYIRERTATLSGQLLKPFPPQKMQLEVLPDSRTSNFIITSYPNGQQKKMPQSLEVLSKIDGSKGIIKTDMANVQDADFRQEFNWLSNNNINIDGNGNITLIGSNITINAHSSINELKELIKTQSDFINQSTQVINEIKSPNLKALGNNIYISEIQNLVEDATDENLGKAINSLILKTRDVNSIYASLLTLKGEYKLMIEDIYNGLYVDQKRKKIQIRLVKILDAYKSGLHG